MLNKILIGFLVVITGIFGFATYYYVVHSLSDILGYILGCVWVLMFFVWREVIIENKD